MSLILGMLRRSNMNFILKYKQEAITRIKTIVKQVVFETLAENDCDADGPYNIEQAQTLDLNKWIELMRTVTTSLVKLLHRIKVRKLLETIFKFLKVEIIGSYSNISEVKQKV